MLENFGKKQIRVDLPLEAIAAFDQTMNYQIASLLVRRLTHAHERDERAIEVDALEQFELAAVDVEREEVDFAHAERAKNGVEREAWRVRVRVRSKVAYDGLEREVESGRVVGVLGEAANARSTQRDARVERVDALIG